MAAMAALALLTARPAAAATATASFQVTATVLKACFVSTPATLAFGAYTASAASTSTTSFNVTCTVGTPYSVGLNAGNGTGASVTNRLMTSATAGAGNNLLTYGLFKDNAYSTNWDNSASGTGLSGNGLLQPYTIYGQIAAGQYAAAPAADYVDTILLTVTY
ncbi:MAG: SCPU domain-containing protein [Comamonadaceae bacterium]|nr:MAG: SCPU domain-containing protein [Comamonadaceae bacterium]